MPPRTIFIIPHLPKILRRNWLEFDSYFVIKYTRHLIGEKMLETIIIGIAILLSLVALVMVWLANYQSKTLAKQIQGVNSRVSSLNHDLEIEQRQTEQELFRLWLELKQLQDEPVDNPPPPSSHLLK